MFNTCYQWLLSFFYAEQEPVEELDLNDFRVVDIDGQSWEMTLPTFPAAPQGVRIGFIQPGMPYGVQEYKNKWMRIEGNSLISGWIPDQFIIQTLDGERYNFYWVNRQNPIKNPKTFRPIYRLQSRGRTMSHDLVECDSDSNESTDSLSDSTDSEDKN